MHCPFCESEHTKVLESRIKKEGIRLHRRRECLSCKTRFTTSETPIKLPENYINPHLEQAS